MQSVNGTMRTTEAHHAAQATAVAAEQPTPTLDDLQADLVRLKHERAVLYTEANDVAVQLAAARQVFLSVGLASDGWTGDLRGSLLAWASAERLVDAIAAEESLLLALEKEQRELRRDIFEIYAAIMKSVRAAPSTPIGATKTHALVGLRLHLDLVDARIVSAYGGLQPLHKRLWEAKTRRAASSDYCGAVQRTHARVAELERVRSNLKQELADVGFRMAIVDLRLTSARLSSLQQAMERIQAMGRAIDAREAKQ